MDNDMLMAKATPPGWINLAVGEPGVLQDLFTVHFQHGLRLRTEPYQAYPEPGGLSHLRDELRRYTNQENPYQTPHIVVTNGAKQALLAAYYAYRKLKNLTAFSHRRPAWPSHRTLAELAGYTHFFSFHPDTVDAKLREHTLIVNTSPNNPDGSIDKTECDIFDAAYAHAMYGFDWATDVPKHETSVHSAAKLFGLSGDRIGWLATSNPEIARLASEYVEATTSGVALAVQHRLFSFMTTVRDDRLTARKAYNDVAAQMAAQRARLQEVLALSVQTQGMFAWFESSRALDVCLTQAKVVTLPGAACGMTGWRRLNIGASPFSYELAMERLQKAAEQYLL